jgi:predicted transcriptional regulator
MAATTTIRLPPKLRARLRALARQTGRSVHSLIVEGVERHAAYEERLCALIRAAEGAEAEIARIGALYPADEVHAWMERLAAGSGSPRPKPCQR